MPGLLSAAAEPQLIRHREAEVVREDAGVGKEEVEAAEMVAAEHGAAVEQEEEVQEEEVEREEQEETAEEDTRRVDSAPLVGATQLLLPSVLPPPRLLLLLLICAEMDLSTLSLPLSCCCCCCLGLLIALRAAELPDGLDGRCADTEPSGLGGPAGELLPADTALPGLAESWAVVRRLTCSWPPCASLPRWEGTFEYNSVTALVLGWRT